jgi:hypothetical protein
VGDAEALAAICARLSARDVERFHRRWQARMPSPFTAADRRRGYRYALAFRQLELSDASRSLRALVSGLIPSYTARQMTYDQRRLRRKGFIRRLPGIQRYQLTADGRRLAVSFTKIYTRIVCPSLAELDPTLSDPAARRTALGRPGASSSERSKPASPTPPSRPEKMTRP